MMEEESRIISSLKKEEDDNMDLSLRPKTLDEYIGQDKIKDMLSIFIKAAKLRGETLDHVLLYGPPGLGKTTLAHIIAQEMGVNIRVTSGPNIEKPRDLAALLTNLSSGDVLFIDEIHRLNASVEEVLYPAMEDFSLDIIMGQGPSARTMKLELKPFTLVGATTRAGMLTSPLRDRFGIISRLQIYSSDELKTIVKRSASILGIDINESGALEIARRSRGTPRIANRLLKRVRDYAQVKAGGMISDEIADLGLKMLGVDNIGLDNSDRLILEAIIKKFSGGPVGLETLAATTGEESGTIEDVIEPFLLQLGFIKKTPRGRIATPIAYDHLGIDFPADPQTKLF